MSETTQPQRTLVKKLAAIMAEVERVPKTGRNEFHRYDYATEADIAAAVRKGMAERSLILFPSVEKAELVDIPTKSGTQKLCTLTVRFTLEDGDSGERREYVLIGQGTDAGDKAAYKAITGAEKYALLKLFLIPTGDDPETEAAPPPKRAVAPRPQVAPDAPIMQPRSNAYAGGLSGSQLSEDPVMEFGKGKGKKASELTDAGLKWYLERARESVEKNDPKWHAANVKRLEVLEAHAAKRTGGALQ